MCKGLSKHCIDLPVHHQNQLNLYQLKAHPREGIHFMINQRKFIRQDELSVTRSDRSGHVIDGIGISNHASVCITLMVLPCYKKNGVHNSNINGMIMNVNDAYSSSEIISFAGV